MTKIKIEGPNSKVIGLLITRALRDGGLKVNHWTEVTPGGVASSRRDAAREGSDVSIVSMSR